MHKMAANISFHEFLNTIPYGVRHNLWKIREFLERDHSLINEQDTYKRTPLLRVIIDSYCYSEIVMLFLHFGADVNIKDQFNNTPLLAALDNFRDESIVKALLEKGASIEDYIPLDRTPLRYTFADCNWTRRKNFKWKTNILNLLLKAGLDLNYISYKSFYYPRSPLCLVLTDGADMRDVELLLSKGASLKACMLHKSPLHCVTDGRTGALLKASVVQLLLDIQAREGEVVLSSLEPLQKALAGRHYETTAIKLLLDHSDENAITDWIQQTNGNLHAMVKNADCKAEIVKLFIQRGACISKLNEHGETVLHSFLQFSSLCTRDTNLLELLLKEGVPMNIQCNGETALQKAVDKLFGKYVINMLLAYGARLYPNGIRILEMALRNSKVYKQGPYVLKTLMKYFFLEFPGFNIERLVKNYDCEPDCDTLIVFASEYTSEVKRMESKNVNSDCTLHRFMSDNVLIDNWNRLLKILSNNEFPMYVDVILYKMSASRHAEEFIQNYLHELKVYSGDDYPGKAEDEAKGKARFIKKVALNFDVICNIALFLSDVDLLSLIVAFYREHDKPLMKRNTDSKHFIMFQKRRKLDQ